MFNQELINAGMKQMDETDQAIERSKQVVHQTIEVGTQTATTLKGQVSVLCQIYFRKGEIISYQTFDVSCHQIVQTEQMGWIVNELDSIQFSIKKALKLVKEIGRQVATDKCIMLLLVLIVCGVIAIIVVKASKSKLRIQAQLQEAMQDHEELTKEIDVFKEKLEKQRTRQEEELPQMKVNWKLYKPL
ncbi:putative plant SNARE [Arachis hypogaea]|nr:putative plant SNARE [Arachis hypogaea]